MHIIYFIDTNVYTMNKIIHRNDKYLKYWYLGSTGRGKEIGLEKIHNSIIFVWFSFIKRNGGKRKEQVVFTQVEKIEITSVMRNTRHKHKEAEMNTLNILVGE